MSEPKRVLVVDDSVFARKIVSDIINSSPELTVAATASDGEEALALIDELRPDVVTLDVEMPKMDGIETLRQLMERRPTPVLMISSLTAEGTKESIRALNLGAVDVMPKPHGTHSIGLGQHREELISKILAASQISVSALSQRHEPLITAPRRGLPRREGAFPVVMIASSTGGPRALRLVLASLSGEDRAGYVIVQHMPAGFTRSLAESLNEITSLEVREAEPGDVPSPGTALLARAGLHCVFSGKGSVEHNTAPPLWGVRPAADVTFASAVTALAGRLVGVVLTGMGRDGANGLKLIRDSGGITIAEDQSTCVVYGMPRAAAEAGAVDRVVPLPGMADAIRDSVFATCAHLARMRSERAA